jgi:hypothetical protein
MVEADIRRLDAQPGRSLDVLEADIWLGVDARIKTRMEWRVLISCQATVLAIALLGSMAIGSQTAVFGGPVAGPGIFSAGADLSPSSRLIGR